MGFLRGCDIEFGLATARVRSRMVAVRCSGERKWNLAHVPFEAEDALAESQLPEL